MKVTVEITLSKTEADKEEVEARLRYMIDGCSNATSSFVNTLMRLSRANTWELTNLKVED